MDGRILETFIAKSHLEEGDHDTGYVTEHQIASLPSCLLGFLAPPGAAGEHQGRVPQPEVSTGQGGRGSLATSPATPKWRERSVLCCKMSQE